MPKIIKNEILQTIKYFCTQKTPRPNQIFNKILKVIVIKICNYLQQIMNDSFTLAYYLLHFKESIVIILRKHGNNRDFTSSKTYRPISLLNTISKILKLILAIRMSHMAIAHNLLSKTYFGDWQELCIETAIYNLLKNIYIA